MSLTYLHLNFELVYVSYGNEFESLPDATARIFFVFAELDLTFIVPKICLEVLQPKKFHSWTESKRRDASEFQIADEITPTKLFILDYEPLKLKLYSASFPFDLCTNVEGTNFFLLFLNCGAALCSLQQITRQRRALLLLIHAI